MDALYKSILKACVSAVRKGRTLADAVDVAWTEEDVPKQLYYRTKAVLVRDVAKQLGISTGDTAALEAAYIRTVNDTQLRVQIAVTSARMRADIKKEMQTAMKYQKGLWEASRDLRDLALEGGADSATAAERGLRDLYKSPLEEQARVIARRLDAGIKTDQLRYSYEKLLKSAETLDPAKILKQQEYTMRAKLKQHGERIVQTEKARAIESANREVMANDERVQAVKIVIEKRHHHVSDICDAVCSADCGLGPGVYPLVSVPVLPLHPHCNCRSYPVYVLPKNAKQSKSPMSAVLDHADGEGIRVSQFSFVPIRRMR